VEAVSGHPPVSDPPGDRSSQATIEPADLADRLSRLEPVTILDVRAEAKDSIEAAGASVRHLPASHVLADPDQVAAQLDGPVAVVCERGLTAQGVTDALRARGVEAMVLDGGMRGWIGTLQARPVELGIDGLDVIQVQRPGRGCLSYVIAAGGEALVVDPAPDPGFYLDLARHLDAQVTTVFDTHIHADHISGARELAMAAGATLRLSEAALARGVTYSDRLVPVADGEELVVGGVTLRALSLPGHTTDMTGLVIEGRALIGGDSLFADGIARPDLQRGDSEGARAMAATLHATLHERILALGDDVILLPCHTHPGVHLEAIAPRLAEVRKAVPELGILDPEEFAREVTAAMPPRPANYEEIIAVNSGTHRFDPELETGGNSCATR
jgi:glyoxylase-like metal-dependent hydrolase (beta-lactamase superfamily II)/rhodanese-related sulfurtransferase